MQSISYSGSVIYDALQRNEIHCLHFTVISNLSLPLMATNYYLLTVSLSHLVKRNSSSDRLVVGSAV